VGDFYDVSTVDKDHVAVVVADVSGKGLRAALATVMVKYTLRAYAAEDPTPSRVLTRFNRFLCEHGDLEGFITVSYGLLNVRTGELQWGSAGHEPSLIVRPQGGAQSPVFEMLEETALVAGAMPRHRVRGLHDLPGPRRPARPVHRRDRRRPPAHRRTRRRSACSGSR
jgi:sigma-B regulation protein RsbU (phosphoserine phosphatase)